MYLPVNDLQQSLDTVWPFRFSVEDDGEVMRVYSNFDEPVFDFHLASEVGSEEVYWGPFYIVFMDPDIGINRYRKPLYFGPAVALLTHLVTFDDLNGMELRTRGLPPEDWEPLYN